MNPFQYQAEEVKRPLVTALIRIALVAGCLFTGMHNYGLYHRGLSGAVDATMRKLVAFGIAFILEAAFYFSVEGRGRVFVTDQQRQASAIGALVIFGIIALNTITDHAMNIGKVTEGDWLNAWATYGAAGCVVGIVGYIGFLKAYSVEAMLAAEAAKAVAQRVKVASSMQSEVLGEEAVKEKYRQQARQWAVSIVDSATTIEAPRKPIEAEKRIMINANNPVVLPPRKDSHPNA